MNLVTKSLDLAAETSTFRHPTDEELAIINTRTQREFTADEMYVLTVHLYNDIQDKAGDKATEDFLNEVALLAAEHNLPGIFDHNEKAAETWANIFAAQVVDNGEYKEVIAKAYVAITDDTKKILEKIESGAISGVSLSFYPSETEYIDGVNYLKHCAELREFSLVVAPCLYNAFVSKALPNDLNSPVNPQPSEGDKTTVNQNNTGGTRMKRIDYFKKLMKKSMEDGSDTAEVSTSLLPLLDEPDAELSDIEIALQEENDKLKTENEELKAKVAELEDKLAAAGDEAAAAEGEAIETLLDAEIDKMNPASPVIKSHMLADIDRTKLVLKDGKIEGLDEQLELIKKSWDGHFGKTEPALQKKPFMSVSTKKSQTKAASFREACQNSFGN